MKKIIREEETHYKECYLCGGSVPCWDYCADKPIPDDGEPSLCDSCHDKEKSSIDERIIDGLKLLTKEVKELNKRVDKLEERVGRISYL